MKRLMEAVSQSEVLNKGRCDGRRCQHRGRKQKGDRAVLAAQADRGPWDKSAGRGQRRRSQISNDRGGAFRVQAVASEVAVSVERRVGTSHQKCVGSTLQRHLGPWPRGRVERKMVAQSQTCAAKERSLPEK